MISCSALIVDNDLECCNAADKSINVMHITSSAA